ncbi:hypothetical protein SAMN02745223_00280 [Devosia limi DSM 17137]|uniref:Uncharacterized protein n=2 Tax=Devosia TaxID=46913 RepID=A0A1M4T6H8_9HYPH|nr:hypothetical protein SAMN02745223_00280 [Devosia limi DSM 17137]
MAGCVARPVGDFGRARPSFTHDVAMPAVGARLAASRGEPVSNFNQTDQEKLMHDRVWRFLVADHAKDWFYNSAVELQRTRITAATDMTFAIDRYYGWLKQTHFQSSTVRYSRVGRDIAADLDTIPATFAAICAVEEIDRQRAQALAGLSGIEPAVAANARARRTENDMRINWFARALTYRFQSYDYALDHLLVETPHDQSLAVDAALSRLSNYVKQANSRDFCARKSGPGWAGEIVLPSRYQTKPIDTEIIDQK